MILELQKARRAVKPRWESHHQQAQKGRQWECPSPRVSQRKVRQSFWESLKQSQSTKNSPGRVLDLGSPHTLEESWPGGVAWCKSQKMDSEHSQFYSSSGRWATGSQVWKLETAEESEAERAQRFLGIQSPKLRPAKRTPTAVLGSSSSRKN